MIDLESEQIIATSDALTSASTDVMIGFNKAHQLLEEKLKYSQLNNVEKLGCSSAAGGLKLVAIGLTPALTAEAANRAALGAGAKVLKTYSFELNKSEINEIKAINPDIILLAGGADGGNKNCIIYNANMLAENLAHVPIVAAGNKTAVDELENIFKKKNMYYKLTANVMPQINQLNVEPAREAIREVFIEKIIDAKGMHRAREMFGGVLLSTPAAVLKAVSVLANGTDREEGLGDLVLIDVGGATTDVYSVAEGEPTKPGVMLKGLEEPFEKRTVEGDMGVRVSALSLWESAGTRKIAQYLPQSPFETENRCRLLAERIDLLPATAAEIEFDEALGMTAIDIAMERHVGFLENVYTPMGEMIVQTGKDLLNVAYLIGTGGVLTHSQRPEKMMGAALWQPHKPNCLKPIKPKLLIDKSYVMASLGLLAEKYPCQALRMMKKYLG